MRGSMRILRMPDLQQHLMIDLTVIVLLYSASDSPYTVAFSFFSV